MRRILDFLNAPIAGWAPMLHEDQTELERLRERAKNVLEVFSIEDLREFVREHEELAKLKEE
ncbi:hypothetical protein [Bradyrhizobium pachyrhizi]|uniref:hypothetical protein n=1 Tax=Bradyrhizobium pachyrhizi TaxID=280333 RepID=UPI0018F8BE0C|nr:hypothetical protein [Bradyrhizobium pachyrhizi]